MVQGFFFFLLLIGWFFFWLIIYWKGVGFVFMKLPGMSTGIYLAVLGSGFILVFLFWWFPGLFRWLLTLSLVGLPLVLYLLWRNRRWEVREMADEVQSRMGTAKRRLDEDPKDWVSWLVLGKTYDKQNRLGEAIEAYSRALSLMGTIPIRSKTEAHVEFLRKVLEKERALQTLGCGQCGTKNLPKERNCVNCQAPLYRTFFHWVSANLELKVKYALVGIVVLCSFFLFWVNPLLVTLLILLWSFDLIYFSLPVEFKS